MVLEPADIVSTTVVQDGERTITYQKLDAGRMAEKIALAEASRKAAAAVEVPADPSPADPADEMPVRTVMFGAGVLVADPARPENALSEIRLWPQDGPGQPFTLWANANFLWLTGIGEVIHGGTRHHLMAMISPGVSEVPENLTFPQENGAGYVVTEGNPTAEDLAPVQALLDRYNDPAERARLRAAYEARLAGYAAREAERRANPPEKKDLLIRYWIPSTSTVPREGGAR